MNMNIWEREGSIAEAYWRTGRADFPVYDMHGHMGPHGQIYFEACEAGAMVRHLERAGVERLVFSHHWALWTPDFGNQDVYEITRRHPERLRMYVALNPNYPERIARDVEAFESWRPLAVGFKCLSGYHRVRADDPAHAPAYEYADAHGLPILFHTWGGDGHASVEIMEALAQRYPRAIFLMGHSFRPDWKGVARIAASCPDNVYFELTSIPGTAGMVEKLCELVGARRLLFGTDLPWFDEYQAIGGIIGADITDDDRRDILYRNARRVLGEK